MTIATEVQRIKDNIANTYTALGEKGATIPEVQNSANLADTVATVTTGGGGSGGESSDIKYKAFIDDLIEKIVVDGKTDFSDVNAKQQIINESKKIYSVCGYTFYEQTKCVKITSTSYIKFLLYPSSATFENNMVIFDESSDEKWVIVTFEATGTYSIFGNYIYGDTQIEGTLSTEVDKCATIEYFYYRTTVGRERSDDFISTIPAFNAKDIRLKGLKQNSESLLYFWPIGRMQNIEEIIDMLKSVWPVDSLVRFNMFGGGNSSYTPLTKFGNNFPYIVDFSSNTSNIDFTKTSMVKPVGFYNIRMKLGNSNFKISKFNGYFQNDMNYDASGSLATICYTKECLKYMADNAPTVSGKTLTIGSYNIRTAGDASGEIIQTLVSKGWTVN